MLRSFDDDPSRTVVLPGGQRAHRDHVAQGDVIARRFEHPCEGVRSLVGNGLSNQTFISVRDGVVAVDTGECTEEMRSALDELRAVDRSPIVGVVYTHFHYVDGTAAIAAEPGNASPLPIVGHGRIATNRTRASAEIGPSYARGLVEQFAIALPDAGPDGLVNVGLGHWYRNPAHAPYTRGHLPVTLPLGDGEGSFELGGTSFEWVHAPSDADDSVNFHVPSLGLCIHNSVWPTLFNVFAIRGEEYRDPRGRQPHAQHLHRRRTTTRCGRRCSTSLRSAARSTATRASSSPASTASSSGRPSTSSARTVRRSPVGRRSAIASRGRAMRSSSCGTRPSAASTRAGPPTSSRPGCGSRRSTTATT